MKVQFEIFNQIKNFYLNKLRHMITCERLTDIVVSYNISEISVIIIKR